VFRPKLAFNYPIWICILVAVIFSSTLLLGGNRVLIGTQHASVLPYWATWWTPHALQNNYDIVFNSQTLFPVGNNHLAHISPVTSIFYTVFKTILGPVAGYNILVLMYCFLNSFVAYYWLNKTWGLNRLWALVGGLLVAYNPATWSLLQQGNIALMGFFMVIIACLCWDAFLELPSPKRAVLLASSLYAIILMNMLYIAIILSFWLPYALYSAWHSKKRGELLDGMLLSVCCFILLTAFYPLPAFLWSSYVDIYTPIETAISTQAQHSGFWIGILVVMVCGLMLLPMTHHQRRFWFLIAASHAIFAIRPNFAPYAIFSQFVPRSDFSVEPRLYLLPFIYGAAVVMGSAFSKFEASLSARLYRIVPILAVGIFLLLSGWSIFLPTTPVQPIQDLEQIASDTENYLIAFFPTGIVSAEESFGSTDYAALGMVYAPWHRKRVIGGVTVGDFTDEQTVYEENPLLRVLANYSVGDPIASVPLIRNDVERWRLAYVIVANEVTTDTTGLHQWLSWTNTFCQVEAQDTRELWRARWHPAGCPQPYTIDIGAMNDFYAVQAGWAAPEQWGDISVRWASSEADAELILWATPASDYMLRLRAVAPPASQQDVTVFVNDTELGRINLTQDWQDYELLLPRTTIAASHRVELRFEHSTTVNLEGRILNAAYDTVSLVPVE
jgi:hypothetical protein